MKPSRTLSLAAGMATALGFLLASPGLLLLFAASQIHDIAVRRELDAHAHLLDPES